MKTLLSFILSIMIITETGFSQIEVWKIEEGKLPNGKTYTGNVSMKQIGNAYDVDWVTSAGNYGGIGIKAANKLFVGYGIGVGDYGVVVYKASANKKSFEGRWTTGKMNGGMGSETITKNSAGQYEVIGRNPNGSPYKGKLMMQKTGDTYQVQWTVAGITYNGVGFTSDNLLVVGFGFGQTFGMVEYTIMGNKALGSWAMGGGSAKGIENLTK